eukprot:scaffold7039_cov255-Pinguiococcus_pyrenoidosus.AAC.14
MGGRGEKDRWGGWWRSASLCKARSALFRFHAAHQPLLEHHPATRTDAKGEMRSRSETWIG